MKLTLAIAALLAASTSLYAADDPAPERAADCIAKSHDPVGCFVEQATFRFLICKLKVEGAIVGLPLDATSCSTNGDRALSDFYSAALKTFAKNKVAQSMTKDYYASWISSMGALVPSGEILAMTWRSQAAKMEAELTQKGERLKLEK